MHKLLTYIIIVYYFSTLAFKMLILRVKKFLAYVKTSLRLCYLSCIIMLSSQAGLNDDSYITLHLVLGNVIGVEYK